MTDLTIRDYTPADFDAVVALWRSAGLTRPWNDPADDIALCLSSGHGAVLLGFADGALAASVMVGHDGHRGWVYYLAVDRARARRGHGRAMMAAAERWLAARGVPKVQLMLRAGNEAAAGFYRRLGYVDSGSHVFERWLARPAHAKAGPGRLEIVITYLEMLAPPAPQPPRLPPHRLALLRLARPSTAFYRYLYGTVGEPWFWYERRGLDDGALAELIGAPGVEIDVLYADGEPAGYYELDFRAAPDVNLAYFGLVPRFIGRGLGGFLLGRAVDEAWRRGCRRLWVHTCSLDHPRALALYQKAGFVPYKQETKVIDDPRPLGLIPAGVKLPAAARLAAPD